RLTDSSTPHNYTPSLPDALPILLGMLIDDHREAQQLFKDFKSARDDGRKAEIVRHTCTALTAHTKIEEEHFYPFLREADPDAFRSEEHTSELQSRENLVCRLLLA